jgi:predicted transcriptional regulator of viral defense system
MESGLSSQVTIQRHIPKSVAPIVADFEMFGRDVVSTRDVARAIDATAGSPRVENAVRTLVELGWLRPLPTRGAYEFMPARGGPFPAGDPLVEARAVRAKRPDFRLAVVGSGAAFLRGFSERPPAEYAIAIDKRQGGSVALAAAYDVVKTTGERIAGIPDLHGIAVSDAAHLLADAALWPDRVGDVRDSDHWLRRALAATEPAAAATTARRVGTAAAARMAYLASRFGARDVAAAVAATLRGRARTFIGKASAPVVARDPTLGVDDRLGVATLG